MRELNQRFIIGVICILNLKFSCSFKIFAPNKIKNLNNKDRIITVTGNKISVERKMNRSAIELKLRIIII